MDIVYNLKRFFNEQQDEAAIPGLGVFYKSTEDKDGKPLPKGDSVILFIEKTPRSNAFVNFLGYEENLTESESIEVLERWVSSILNDLKTRKAALIPNLGKFEIKKGGVVFEPDLDQNPAHTYLSEYGLESEAPKSKVKVEKIPSREKQQKNPMTFWLIIAAAVVVLAGGGMACYKTIPEFKFFVDDLTGSSAQTARPAQQIVIAPPAIDLDDLHDEDEPFTDTPEVPQRQPQAAAQQPAQPAAPQPQPTAQPTQQPSQQRATTQQPTTQPTQQRATTQQPARDGSNLAFQVIGGAFSVRGNAESLQAQMRTDGFASTIIFDGAKQLYYVTLGGFDSMEKALEFKERVRTTRGIGCWIYTR